MRALIGQLAIYHLPVGVPQIEANYANLLSCLIVTAFRCFADFLHHCCQSRSRKPLFLYSFCEEAPPIAELAIIVKGLKTLMGHYRPTTKHFWKITDDWKETKTWRKCNFNLWSCLSELCTVLTFDDSFTLLEDQRIFSDHEDHEQNWDNLRRLLFYRYHLWQYGRSFHSKYSKLHPQCNVQYHNMCEQLHDSSCD